jgi:predicted ester cyclase
MGVPATGKRVTINAISIDTIKDGKIVDSWAVIHWLSLLQQIGATNLPTSTPV